MQGHLEECMECRELLRSLQAIVRGLGTMRGEQGELVAGTVLASLQRRLGELPPTAA